MKKLVALAALYLCAWGAVTFFFYDWSNAAAERGRRAAALGEEHAAQLKAPEGQVRLEDACKDKLEPGTPGMIASYVAKTGVKPAKDENTWDEVVVGFGRTLQEEIVRKSGFPPLELSRAALSTANPFDWLPHLKAAQAGSPELGAVRYLVVARYFSLTLPTNEGTDGYTRGAGEFSARVVTFPGGEPLCEGRGEVRMKERVNASGRGETKEAAQAAALENAAKLVPFVFSVSVTTSPLHAVCEAGGPGLCKLTGQWVGR